MALWDGIPKACDLYDNFDDNSLDATKWGSFGTGITETSGQLQMASTLAPSYKGIYSNENWDLTDSEISSQLINAGNQALASWQVIPVLAQPDATNQLYWLVQGNTIYAVKVVAGVTTNVYSAAYSSSTHKFFKIKERFNKVQYKYSTDGEVWTTAFEMATPFDVGNVSVQAQCGTYAAEASTTTGIIDNYNCQASLRTDLTSPFAYGATYNQFTSPANGYSLDGLYATSSTNGHRQDYYNYGFTIPTGATIVGIEILLTAKQAAGSTNSLAVDLSGNAGSSFTATKSTATLTTSATVYTLGGPTDTWGKSWSASEFSNANFRMRLTNTVSGGNTTQYDGATIRIYYTFSQTATVEAVNAIRKRLTIKADGLFGELFSIYSYPTDARLGFSGGYIYDGSNLALYHYLNVGQTWNATSAEVGYLRFDTSAIPDNARIVSAKLVMYSSGTQNSPTGWMIEARSYNMGHRLDTDDWYKTTKIVDKLPLLAVQKIDELRYGSDANEFVSTDAMVRNLNTSGFTGIMLVSNRLVNNVYGDYGGSSNADRAFFYSPNNTDYEPRLVIEYDDVVEYPDEKRDKRIEVRLYDKDENFVRNLKTVADEYALSNEINSAGSAYDFKLAEDMDTIDEDIAIGSIIKVYVYDEVRADGILVYDGKVTGVKAQEDYITVGSVSRSSAMGRESFEKVTSVTTFAPAYPTTMTAIPKTLAATNNWCAQSFIAPYTNLSQLYIWATTAIDDPQVAIHEANGSQPGDLFAEASDVHSVGYDNSVGANVYLVSFRTPLELEPGIRYHVVIKGIATIITGATFYSDGTLWDSSNSGTIWTEDTTKDVFIMYRFGKYSTTVSYTDEDPAYIIRDVLDAYARVGGEVVYDGGSVLYTNEYESDSADTNVTLTIQNVTMIDALRKALEYAPKNWYFVIDVPQNKLYFKKRSDEPEYSLVVGQNINDPVINVSDKDMSNMVYFTGGDTGAGTNLYVKGSKQGSVDLYGRYATPITDNRVTSSATAQKAINKVLGEKSTPTIESAMNVLDVPMNGVNGYIIENLLPGQSVCLNNIGKWGVQHLDSVTLDDIWLDYRLYDYSTFVLQIQKVTLRPGYATLQLESPRTEIAKVLYQQTKGLQDTNTIANPDTPS